MGEPLMGAKVTNSHDDIHNEFDNALPFERPIECHSMDNQLAATGNVVVPFRM